MNNNQLLGIIGSALLFFGVFAPILSAPIVGNINYFMNGKGDGTIVLILAVISFVLTLMKKYKGLWITGLGSVAIILITFIILQNRLSSMKSVMKRELAGNPFAGFAEIMTQTIQFQWGWPLLIIGAALLIICAAKEQNYRTEPTANTKFIIRWDAIIYIISGIIIVVVTFCIIIKYVFDISLISLIKQ
jgi:hypothetical protein